MMRSLAAAFVAGVIFGGVGALVFIAPVTHSSGAASILAGACPVEEPGLSAAARAGTAPVFSRPQTRVLPTPQVSAPAPERIIRYVESELEASTPGADR